MQRKLIALGALCSLPAIAFTQKVPQLSAEGHEYLTYQSANDLKKEYPALSHLGQVVIELRQKTRCNECDVFGAKSFEVLSAVIGQRWVDMMGFTKPAPDMTRCLDAVAQDNEEVQYDHFLRKKCDVGKAGRDAAIAGGVDRIRRYWNLAVNAKAGHTIVVVDGGATRVKMQVDEAFFHFGRASHVLQDSYSPEHTVRPDKFTLADVKTYVCTPGALLHAHTTGKQIPKTITDMPGPAPGDNLRPNGSSMSREAQWALEAMRDFWRAFMAARINKKDAKKQLDLVLGKYFRKGAYKTPHVNELDTVHCLRTVAEVNQIEARRAACLKSTGTGPEPLKPDFGWGPGGPGTLGNAGFAFRTKIGTPAPKRSKCIDAKYTSGVPADQFLDDTDVAATLALHALDWAKQTVAAIEGDIASALIKLGDFADTESHRLHGFETCLSQHVPKLAKDLARQSLGMIKMHRATHFWTRASLDQKWLKASTAERKKALQKPLAEVKAESLNALYRARADGVRRAMEWFGEANKSTAARKFGDVFDEALKLKGPQGSTKYKAAKVSSRALESELDAEVAKFTRK